MRRWKDPEFRNFILNSAFELCKKNNVELLYLVFFGSALYGTDTAASDADARGIFLPRNDDLILGKEKHSLHFTTGIQDKRNTSGDMDIDLWSLQYWLLELLRKGDTGAVDLLFSVSHAECVLYKNPAMDRIFAGANRLIDESFCAAAAGYALHQAKKYGIKGSRLGLLRRMQAWIADKDDKARIRDILETLRNEFEDDPYLEYLDDGLKIGGKIYPHAISIKEAKLRLAKETAKYGDRAEDALRNQGIDFKALSHAARAIAQMEALLLNGRISYPLENRQELLEIKQGKFTWPELEPRILAGIERLNSLRAASRNEQCALSGWSQAFAESCVLSIAKGDDSLNAYMQNLLREIEKEENVKILYAVESGSRSWGMASEDSDFDVRFIYIHDKDWYLRNNIKRRKDVIQLPFRNSPFGIIDAAGWDIAKALQLFNKSNASIFEWIVTKLRYKTDETFLDLMHASLSTAIYPKTLFHHYHNLARKCWESYKNSKNLKSLGYAVRGMLCAYAICRLDELPCPYPPMNMKELAKMTVPLLPASLRGKNRLEEAIELLIAAKVSSEKTAGEAPQPITDFIEFMLDEKNYKTPGDNPERVHLETEEIFLRLLEKNGLSENPRI